jgi:hypothetical protein
MVTEYRCYLIHSHLGAFLYGPFKSIYVFGGCDSDMYMSAMKGWWCLYGDNLHFAMLTMWIGYLAMIQMTFPVCDADGVSFRLSEYLDAMGTFFFV